MNTTPRSRRLHIGIFGKRNAGKSSLLNAITGQDTAVVSPIKGTTTDPVYKTMELAPIGPVVFIDTPGTDDSGELGDLRVEKAKNILRKCDIALLAVDCAEGISHEDRSLIRAFEAADVKYLIVCNKSDLNKLAEPGCIHVSAVTGDGIHELKEAIAQLGADIPHNGRLVADLLSAGDIVLLVTPIDESAPKGRLILPQQQVIRDVLEAGAVPVLTQTAGLQNVINKQLSVLPRIIITDSQVFGEVSKAIPEGIALTSFSILMARYNGVLEDAAQNAAVIDRLCDGDKVLISEGCTHHRQCEDIGTVKIPRWIKQRTGTSPVYEFTSGGGFPEDLSGFRLIIHCGGCMLNAREMRYRQNAARAAGVPMTNYGIAISYMQGILGRCMEAIVN